MPRGGPMGRGGDPTDKAKDFKGAMKRLFSELKPFKILIFSNSFSNFRLYNVYNCSK